MQVCGKHQACNEDDDSCPTARARADPVECRLALVVCGSARVMSTTAESSLFVIFGGTGDLSRRKLLPALARNQADGRLDERFRVVAVGRSPKTDEAFREIARDALVAAGLDRAATDLAVQRLHYHGLGDGTTADYSALASRLDDVSREHSVLPNRSFYMSLPPRAFGPTVDGLGHAGLNAGSGWTRLVVEKPFGKDLESAQRLNRQVHQYFDESQVFRIDHYLGKDTVQNLLVFRLANAFIESNWNRERIEAVQITVAEDVGVGDRAEYYDHSGALRDMVQNHLTQLLTLVAMEVPSSFSAGAIRNEKLKVLKSIQALDTDNVIRGQYTGGVVRGDTIPGYVDAEGVADQSTTETFVALKMYIDSWRWQGVPFFLRTGKCLPRKRTQIAVRFRRAPVSFFERMGCEADTSDVLTITLQPDEGFTFYLDIKKPGSVLEIERVPLRFQYGDHFSQTMPGAYRTLLLDVLRGDQTLFVHADEVEESWRVYTPILRNPPTPHDYVAGTWGPTAADRLSIPEAEL